MVKKILLTVITILFHTLVFSATRTYVGPNNDSWNTASNWSPSGVPTFTDDVIIPSGKIVIITSNALANNVTVSGILKINSGLTFTVYKDFTVNSGGGWDMGTGSDSSTFIVYGNFINYGATNFYKSDIIIAGNLLSPSTSGVQKQGNVIVGGNIIGDFNLTGGTGTNQIYAVNPNATLAITPASINSNVIAGIQISTENQSLMDLVSTVIYGGTCPFSISGTTNTSACTGTNAIFSVSTNGISATYQWEVNEGSGWSDLSDSTTYSGVTTQNLKVSNVTIGMHSYKFRARIMVAGCTKKGNYGFLIVNQSPIITTQPINQLDCEKRSVKFSIIATGTGFTYLWKYKRPGDASFTSITSPISNVTNWDKNIITIGLVGSTQFPDKTQFQVVVSNGMCEVSSNIVTLIVNEILDVIPKATNVTRCYGDTYTYTVLTSYPENVVSYQWKKSVASGSWFVVNDGGVYSGATTASLKITGGTPAESAEYRVYITFVNSTTECSVDSSTRTRLITFLPLATAPQVVLTQPTCLIATGSIAVTVQNATDTYSFDNGLNYQASNIRSGLVGGTYKVIIKNIAGCISSFANSVIVAPVVSIWNGSSWSPRAPTSIDQIVFNGDYQSSGDMSGCSCQVNSGAVVVKSGQTMYVENGIVVNGGSLTFENNASLVQIDDAAANSGNINYMRETTPISNFDYTYWSSPVASQTLYSLSPNTLGDKFYSFDSGLGNWRQENSANIMLIGTGYIIRGPQSHAAPSPKTIFAAKFIGKPNNGYVTTPIGKAGISNLIGNPYPSALDADAFLRANEQVIEGTIYFWTHNTNIGIGVSNPGSGIYAYSSDDYASYNLTGGVATQNVSSSTINGNIPAGSIASGQAFFTKSKAAGNVVFNNSMRMGFGGVKLNNSQFFKNAASTKSGGAIEKNRLWLNLSNSQGAFKQTLVGYIAGATNDYDSAFDGQSINANSFLDFYSINQNKNLTIQGRALPFLNSDTVPLGYSSTIVGTFQISIGQTDGLLVGKDIYLEDKSFNTIHNLKNEPYIFVTEKGVFNNRFVLRYQNSNKTLGTANFEKTENTVLISIVNRVISINSTVGEIGKVQIWNLQGRLVYQKKNLNTSDFVISNLELSNQVLLVKVILQDGKSITKKVIY